MKCYTVRNMEIRNFRGEGRVFNFLLWSVICIYLKRITSRGETRKITKSARLLGGQASNLKNDCILHFPLASSRYVHRVHAPPPPITNMKTPDACDPSDGEAETGRSLGLTA